MDLILSNFLDNIIVVKSFILDLFGDFIGGYVNIKIKILLERFIYGVFVFFFYNI